MNIFALDLDPSEAAKYHVDSHVVKMRLETCQLLISSIHRLRGVTTRISITPKYVDRFFRDFPRIVDGVPAPYGIGYINHPCCKWAYSCLGNFYWLMNLGFELCKEKDYRFGSKDLVCYRVLTFIEKVVGDLDFPNSSVDITPFALAISDDLKIDLSCNESRVEAYREYYRRDKVHLHKWTKRGEPDWIRSRNGN
jgi:hypothetical protein